MIGDLFAWIQKLLKHNLCIHDYKEHIARCYPPFFYKECKKCGRFK